MSIHRISKMSLASALATLLSLSGICQAQSAVDAFERHRALERFTLKMKSNEEKANAGFKVMQWTLDELQAAGQRAQFEQAKNALRALEGQFQAHRARGEGVMINLVWKVKPGRPPLIEFEGNGSITPIYAKSRAAAEQMSRFILRDDQSLEQLWLDPLPASPYKPRSEELVKPGRPPTEYADLVISTLTNTFYDNASRTTSAMNVLNRLAMFDIPPTMVVLNQRGYLKQLTSSIISGEEPYPRLRAALMATLIKGKGPVTDEDRATLEALMNRVSLEERQRKDLRDFLAR